jgi:hypothetical protein
MEKYITKINKHTKYVFPKPFPMKKLISLFLFFTFISGVSAQTNIPISPEEAKSIIIDFRSSDYVQQFPECHSGTDIVRSI